MKKTRIKKRISKYKGNVNTAIKEPFNQVKHDESIEYHIEYRKGLKWNQREDTIYRYMACKNCGQMTLVSNEATACTCTDCVNEMVEPPSYSKKRVSSGRPAGWHFMAKYVDSEGNVFYKGVEQPKLKGTLKPTVIEKKQKISKSERNRIITAANAKVHKLKKELAKAKLKKEIKALKREIARNSKIGAGKIPRSLRYKDNSLDKS